MSDRKTTDTFYSDHHKYEVQKEVHLIAKSDYTVSTDDGEKRSGRFDSRADAVEWAKDQP